VLRSVAIVWAVLLVACEATIGGPPGLGGQDDSADAAPDPADTPTPDAAPTSGLPDAAPPDSGLLASCTERYGAVDGFELCVETDDTCTFIALNGDVSCRTHCAGVGGTCLGAQDNDVGECFDLERDPTADCDTTGKIDLLCTCTR